MKTKRVNFGGESYMVPAGKNPRSIADAQRMERALKAAEKPKEAPQASSKGSGTRKGNTASSTTSSASQRAVYSSTGQNSQNVAGDPRVSGNPQTITHSGIGAGMRPGQENTLRVPTDSPRGSEGGRPSTPRGSGATRTAGSQADRSPSRSQSPKPLTPDRDTRPARSTTQTNTRPPVKTSEITTLAQWKALTREQRRNTPGVPDTMLDAIRKYGLK